MISYTTGNILNSNADALINTVNCEGYMGKGIAYQFKITYPNNNVKYEIACKNGTLKIGHLFITKESNKTIINFPTKDKWRKKSEYSFIEAGLEDLVKNLDELRVKSIAIPPLGCGNGGLEWKRVRSLLELYLVDYSSKYDFIIYEPSRSIKSLKNKKRIPKLNASHLVLMSLKFGLIKFNKLRLQKSAFLVNIYSKEDYFKFNAYNFGPYAHSLDILSRDIKEYQDYYNFSTQEAFQTAKKTIISEAINEKLNLFKTPIERALQYTNKIYKDKDLELHTTLLYIIKNNKNNQDLDFITELKKWPLDKSTRFDQTDIDNALKLMESERLINKSLMGFEINDTIG